MFTVNGESFVPPTVPVLLQILSGAQNASDLLPEGMVYSLPANSSIELSFNGGLLGIEHPIHLHGVRDPLVLAPFAHILTLCFLF